MTYIRPYRDKYLAQVERHGTRDSKGKTASELRFMGHTLMENRNGLISNVSKPMVTLSVMR